MDRGLGEYQSGSADEQDLSVWGVEYRFPGGPVCSVVPITSADCKCNKHLPKYVSPTCITRLSEKLPIQIGYANTAGVISDGCLHNLSYSFF